MLSKRLLKHHDENCRRSQWLWTLILCWQRWIKALVFQPLWWVCVISKCRHHLSLETNLCLSSRILPTASNTLPLQEAAPPVLLLNTKNNLGVLMEKGILSLNLSWREVVHGAKLDHDHLEHYLSSEKCCSDAISLRFLHVTAVFFFFWDITS